MGAQIEWQKSSFSGAQGPECVEVARPLRAAILMRESEAPGVVLRTTPDRLASLLASVKAGEWDRGTE